MLKQKRFLGLGRFSYLFFILCLFLVCLYALHDVQTAEGIGLFFSRQLGMDSRTLVDLLVDGICIAALVLLVYLPCRLLRFTSMASFGRLLVVYLAVVPSLSLAEVLRLFRPGEMIYLWDMALGEALWKWVHSAGTFLQIWVPVMIVLVAVREYTGVKTDDSWHKVIWVAIALLLLILFAVPTAENMILYLCGYLGVLPAFACWEALFEKNERLERWSYILFALLLLKGIYRIVVLLSQM